MPYARYCGVIREGGRKRVVTRQSKPLSAEASKRIIDYLADGFEWGFGGNGCLQLALALIYDVTSDPFLARALHMDFTLSVLDKLDHSKEWVMDSHHIIQWIGTRIGPRNYCHEQIMERSRN